MVKPVGERPGFPNPPKTQAQITSWASDMVKVLNAIVSEQNFRLNRVLPKDGSERMQAPLPFMIYTSAELPLASLWEGAVVFVSDAASGDQFQGSDGAQWLVLKTGTAVAHVMVAAAAVFALTGIAVNLVPPTQIQANQGAYTLTGLAAITFKTSVGIGLSWEEDSWVGTSWEVGTWSDG